MEHRFVGGAHGPIDAGIGIVCEAQNGVVEIWGTVSGDGTEAKAAEDLFEIVVVGHAEGGRHEQLQDEKKQNQGAECEVDLPLARAVMVWTDQHVIYWHLPENGPEGTDGTIWKNGCGGRLSAMAAFVEVVPSGQMWPGAPPYKAKLPAGRPESE